eukprot:829849-Pleurochrysis_carterae.AAC.1
MTYIKNYFGCSNPLGPRQHLYVDTLHRCLGFKEPLITGKQQMLYAMMANPATRRNVSSIEAWHREFLPPTPYPTPPPESDD